MGAFFYIEKAPNPDSSVARWSTWRACSRTWLVGGLVTHQES